MSLPGLPSGFRVHHEHRGSSAKPNAISANRAANRWRRRAPAFVENRPWLLVVLIVRLSNFRGGFGILTYSSGQWQPIYKSVRKA